VFERFTERARQVVVLAQEEARGLKHDYIGTEHLLLGLLREEEGVAARVLESLRISVEEIRARIAELVGVGDQVTSGQIPFTPRAKKVLELALREALSVGDNFIGTEHVLLGLVRENDGVAARVLLEFDADAEKVRNAVIRMLSGPGRRREGMRHRGPVPMRLTWEYHIERWESDGLPAGSGARLAELGADGWQLAAVVPFTGGNELVFQRQSRPRPPRRDPVWTTALIGESGYRPATIADIENAVVAARKSVEESGGDEQYADITAFEKRLDEIVDRVAEALKGKLEVSGATEVDALVDCVRAEKEAAIEAQDFQRAAEIRDVERQLVTVLRDIASVLRTKPDPG
jgi:hypothetical protein